MWYCPTCGEENTDTFQQCWNCVSEEVRNGVAPKLGDASPRSLRSLSWVLARAVIAFLIATLAGLAMFHRQGTSLGEAAAAGAVFGLVVGAIVGVFVWVAFPYQPHRQTASQEQEVE